MMTLHRSSPLLFLLLLLLLSALLLSTVSCSKESEPTKHTIHFDPSLPPLPIENTGRVQILPKQYPETWVFVDEANFFSMFGGKMILLDVAETHPPKRIKGIADKNLLGNFTQAKRKREFYISETFHERGARGKRIDVVTIYDKITLSPIKEIIMPLERLVALPERYAMAVSADERFLFVSNFTPASSFGVIDLESHELVGNIEIPGCVLLYPTGQRNITSICSNGGLLTTIIDQQGHQLSQQRLVPFFDTDKSPVFERPAIIDNIAYLPSFDGRIHEIDLSANVARYVGVWDMLSKKDRASDWRPGGLGLIDYDHQGRMYIVMHQGSYDGSHNHGGSQVWVYNARDKRRVQVIEVPNWAISVAVTRGNRPLLVVTNGELNLDIFDARDGKLIQTIADFGNVTPLLVHKAY